MTPPIDEEKRAMAMIVMGVMVLLSWLMAAAVVTTAFRSDTQ